MVEKGKENYQRICDLYEGNRCKESKGRKEKRIEEGEWKEEKMKPFTRLIVSLNILAS